MNKKTFRIGTVAVSIIFVCVALVMSSLTHTVVSKAGSFKSYQLGELKNPVLLTFSIDGIEFSVHTVGSNFSINGINNTVNSSGESSADNWLVDIQGEIEERKFKDKNEDAEKVVYRITLVGNYVTSKKDFLPLKREEAGPIQELSDDSYKFSFDVSTDPVPGTPQVIASQGDVKVTLQLDQL